MPLISPPAGPQRGPLQTNNKTQTVITFAGVLVIA